MQAAEKRSALTLLLLVFGDIGGVQRKLPTGACANGTPKKESVSEPGSYWPTYSVVPALKAGCFFKFGGSVLEHAAIMPEQIAVVINRRVILFNSLCKFLASY